MKKLMLFSLLSLIVLNIFGRDAEELVGSGASIAIMAHQLPEGLRSLFPEGGVSWDEAFSRAAELGRLRESRTLMLMSAIQAGNTDEFSSGRAELTEYQRALELYRYIHNRALELEAQVFVMPSVYGEKAIVELIQLYYHPYALMAHRR